MFHSVQNLNNRILLYNRSNNRSKLPIQILIIKIREDVKVLKLISCETEILLFSE